jgi:hypothetical protein
MFAGSDLQNGARFGLEWVGSYVRKNAFEQHFALSQQHHSVLQLILLADPKKVLMCQEGQT